MPLRFTSHPSLIAYITCGDPDLATSREIILSAIDAGADIIELGVPFSDPVADGPVIQRAMERACGNHVSLQDVLQLARDVRNARPDAGLVIFSYLNPILRFGLNAFAGAAKDAGVDAVLCTDLTVEESSDYTRALHAHGIAPVFLAAPTSTDERLGRIAAASRGFIYAVSRLGVTGAQAQLSNDARDLVTRLKRITNTPIAVGFGVSNREQFHSVGEFADAVVIGSAIVSIIERERQNAPSAVHEFIRALRA